MSNFYIERYETIKDLVSKGVSIRDIADMYKLSRQRIEQIIKKGRPSYNQRGSTGIPFGLEDNEYFKLYRKANKINYQKIKARSRVFVNLRNGSLTKKPCWCGKKKSEAHHEDYNKPLEVIWLCKRHHVEADLKLKQKRQSLDHL